MGDRDHPNDLEQMILAVVLRSGEKAYGGEVHRRLTELADRSFARAAVYVAIDRLVERGLLSTTLGESRPGRGGRPRRYLAVTPAGRAALEASARTWLRIWDGLEGLPGSGP